MGRNSFIQLSKLTNLAGRISYITSPKRQENLYATCETAQHSFWKDLAVCNQTEFKKSGADGKCIEARELIIALPESFTEYEPQHLLNVFTDYFKKNYGVECVSALHHNKRKTNYHIHLIFAERTLLPQPTVKIASRNMFYDENGKHVRTKKEITDENGQIRKGCTVIKKGEVYEKNIFTVKNPHFKSETFLDEAKQQYTELINIYVKNNDEKLQVFDPNGVYLPTKKIGKNNPKAEQIMADNAVRQEWNRTADLALVSGVEKEKILQIKQTEIKDKTRQSVQKHGWLPDLLRAIIKAAIQFLKQLIRIAELPPKPILKVNMAEFRTMEKTLSEVQAIAREIRNLQNSTLPQLNKQLEETKGIFKGKERKAITEQIQLTEKKISDKTAGISKIIQDKGYSNVQAFMDTYDKSKGAIMDYNLELADWEQRKERILNTKETAELPAPPSKQSVKQQLKQIQAEGKTDRNKQRIFDMER